MTEDRDLRRRAHRLAGMFGDVEAKGRLDTAEIDRAEHSLTRLTAASAPTLTIVRLLHDIQGVAFEPGREATRMHGFLFDKDQNLMNQPSYETLDGETLLRPMHGRQDTEFRCLAYWLEFKNDDDFTGIRFGGIGGGTLLKFGIYQRQSDGAWVSGSPTKQYIVSPEDAIVRARQQRDELLAGDNVLAALGTSDTSDEAYARLQVAMENAAPELSRGGWAPQILVLRPAFAIALNIARLWFVLA
jgi:hypothetical protein